MNLLRKNIITLVLILLTYVWFFIFQNIHTKPPVNVLGAISNITLFIQPDSGRQPILDAINNAQKEILVEVYLMSDRQILDALGQARQRGVDVRVMLEQHPFGGGNLNNKTKQELDRFNIANQWSSPKFALTHEKSIVIDGNIAFILNQNLTTSAFVKNREYDIKDTNIEDVQQIRSIFIADWQRKDPVNYKSNIIESPDTARAQITALLNQAQKTIDVEMEVIEDNEMITLLSEKAKNTTIRILAPPVSQISSNRVAFKKLSQAGIAVKTLTSPYIHAKLIVIDAGRAYVGSVNLSTQSLDQNRELGIILTQPDGINLLIGTFNKDWEIARQYGLN